MLSFGKSFRTNKEKELIKFNENNSMVEINFKKSNYYITNIYCFNSINIYDSYC